MGFGNRNVGAIYGILYFATAISEPIWTLLVAKPDGCIGVGCYRRYCLSSVLGMLFLLGYTVTMMLRDTRKHYCSSKAQIQVEAMLGDGMCRRPRLTSPDSL